MLREVSHVSADSDDGLRRCFADEQLHLLVWYEADKSICGFELTYENASGPRVLRWLPGPGFSHAVVEDRESHRFLHASAVLVECREAVSADLPDRFRAAAGLIPQVEREFVEAKLGEIGSANPSRRSNARRKGY
jgi:hypothetical protein